MYCMTFAIVVHYMVTVNVHYIASTAMFYDVTTITYNKLVQNVLA